MPGEGDAHGRRARRRAAAPRSPVGPVVGWVVFTLVMTGVVLLVLGLAVATVAWLLLAGAVVGGALVAASRFSPPPPVPGAPPHPDGDP